MFLFGCYFKFVNNEKKIQTLKLIWAAFLFQPCLLSFILLKKVNPVETGVSSVPSVYIYLSLVFVFLSLGIYQKMILPFMLKSSNESSKEIDFQRVFTSHIICFALNDAVSLIGFVSVSQIQNPIKSFIPFALVTILLALRMFPRFRPHH